MYLYLGQDTVINTNDIIGIFDLDNTSVSKDTRAYLSSSQKAGRIKEVSQDIPKSFVVCGKKEKLIDYLSQVSVATLKKRSEHLRDF